MCCIVGIVIIAFVGGFVYFLLNNPDKLQSEDYQLKRMSLELSQEKGESPKLEITLPPIPKTPELDFSQFSVDQKDDDDE